MFTQRRESSDRVLARMIASDLGDVVGGLPGDSNGTAILTAWPEDGVDISTGDGDSD
jgi:hypothetical protein